MENTVKNNVRVIKAGRSMKSMIIYTPCYYCDTPVVREKGSYMVVCDKCEIKNAKKVY